MSFYSRQDRHLPVRPNLDQLKHQAKDLLRAIDRGDPEAVDEFKKFHPEASRFGKAKPCRNVRRRSRRACLFMCSHVVLRRKSRNPRVCSNVHSAHCSLLTAHCSLLTAHCSLLTAHCSLLDTAHCSSLTAHRNFGELTFVILFEI